MTAHLLGKGGETSFLECQFRPLPRQALLDIMKRYVFGESDGIATKELIRELQCSKKQVLEGLTDIKALEVTSEKFVLLKEELSWDVKSAVVDSCVEMGWIDDDDEKVDLEVVIKEANLRFAGGSGGYNLELDERFLRIAMMDLGCVTDDNNVVFDTDKIALYFAHTLLRERSPYPMKDFLQTWHTRLPGAHTAAPPLSVLAGLALVEKDSVCYYPSDDLPLAASLRFQKLFKKRELWPMNELDAYVKVLEKEGNVKELLLKYTRIVVDDDGAQWYRKR